MKNNHLKSMKLINLKTLTAFNNVLKIQDQEYARTSNQGQFWNFVGNVNQYILVTDIFGTLYTIAKKDFSAAFAYTSAKLITELTHRDYLGHDATPLAKPLKAGTNIEIVNVYGEVVVLATNDVDIRILVKDLRKFVGFTSANS